MDPLDPIVAGILFLIGVVLFVVAAFPDEPFPNRVRLIAAGLAFCAFVPCWNSFAAA